MLRESMETVVVALKNFLQKLEKEKKVFPEDFRTVDAMRFYSLIKNCVEQFWCWKEQHEWDNYHLRFNPGWVQIKMTLE